MMRREASRLILTMAENHRQLIIAGPRYAGKSALVKRVLSGHTYIDLESPDNAAFARNRPATFFEHYRGDIIIDEFHRVPELFRYIRGATAKRHIVLITSRKPSQSIRQSAARYTPPNATPTKITANTVAKSHVGAITMLPPSIRELDYNRISLERDEYIHSGFMLGAYRKKIDPRETQLNYLTALLQNDIAPLVRVENRDAFKRFLRLLAERVGLALNPYTFADTVGVRPSALVRWLRVLEAHFVIFRVPVYSDRLRVRSRAISAPKFYFTDVGLAAYLLKIQTPDQVHRHPAVGNLFENLVVAEALKAACNSGQDASMFYYRNRDGFEVDLVLPRGRAILPIEIKSSATFNSAFADNIKRFHSFAENILDGYVVYGGAGSDRVNGAKYVNFREVGAIVRGW